ncbi:unnamed protein product [Closterium sp. NIES-53]
MLPTMSASHHLQSTAGGSRLSRSSAAATGCSAPPAGSPAVPPAASSAAPTAGNFGGVGAVPAVAAASPSADACSPRERSFSPRGKRATECRRAPRHRHSRSFSGDFPTFHATAPRSPAHSAIPASNSPLSRRPREDPVETAAYPGNGACSPASPAPSGEFSARCGDTSNGARLSAQRWSLPPGTSVDGGVGMGDCPLMGGLSSSGLASSGADVAFLTSQSPRIDLLRRLKMEAAVAVSSCDSPSFFSPSHAAASTNARDSFFSFERQGSIGLLSEGSCDLGDDGSGSFFRVPAKGSAGETFSNLFRLKGVLGSRGSGSGDSGSFCGGSGSFSNGGGSGSLNGGGSGSFSCGVAVSSTNPGGRGGSARRVSISEEDFWAAVRYSDTDGDSQPGPPPYPSHHSHPPYNHSRDSHQLDANTRAHQRPEELVPLQRVTSITVIARTVSPLVGAPDSLLPAPAAAATTAASPPESLSLPVSPVDDGPAAAFLEASCNPAEPLTDATSAAAEPMHSTSGAAKATVVSRAIATARFATSTSTGSSSGSHVSNSTWTTAVTNLSHESSSSERASSRLSSGLDGAFDAGNGGEFVKGCNSGFGGDTWTGAELSSAESSPRLSPSSPGFFSPSRRSFSHQQDPFQHNSLHGLLHKAEDDEVGNDDDGIEIGAVDWHHSHRFYSEYQQPQHYSRQQQQQPRGRYSARLGAMPFETRNQVQRWEGRKSSDEVQEQDENEDEEQLDEEEVEQEKEQGEEQLQAAGGEEASRAGSTEEVGAELTAAAVAAGTRAFARTRKYRKGASGVVFIPPSDAPEAIRAPDSPRERALARTRKLRDGTSGLVFVPMSDPFASADEICFESRSSPPAAVTTCTGSDEVVSNENVEEEGAGTSTTADRSGCRRNKGEFLKRTLSSVVLKQKVKAGVLAEPGSFGGSAKPKWWRQLLGKKAT